MPELSILIPARGEEWLSATCADLLAHLEADTEIIAVIDGQAAGPPLPTDPRLRVIELRESIGQRAAQNLAARNSTARYVMKLDAHCAVDQGFDRKLIAAMCDDVTLTPVMRNLHVYNWVCDFCEATEYQGPQPATCKECEGAAFHKVLVWNPKPNPSSSAYRFNKELRFKYFPELRGLQARTGLQETMSLQGSCFMATREAYWEKELCDESWGSWGQQGSEVALKTWLSGGRVLCLMDTWYAHQFRVKSGDAIPYPGVGSSQNNAIRISQEIFLNDRWPKQVYPLAWLLERFWAPLQQVGDKEHRWEQADLDRLKARQFNGYTFAPTRGMIYYTDNELPAAIDALVRPRLESISAEKHLPITSASLKRMRGFGEKNVYFPSLRRGIPAMFKQILGALENSTADIVYFTEHDVLYHPSHFDFVPPDDGKVYYNLNLWQVRVSDGHGVYWDAKRVSQLCGYRRVLIEHYRKRLARVEADGYSTAMGFEPGSHNRPERVDDLQSGTYRSEFANLDLKHGGNITPAKWRLADFRNAPTGWQEADELPYWGNLAELFCEKVAA